ncbi:MAG TPA: DUF4097 family beta strand repeat-containing protein [Vicinamibacterales bacterium]|nr:DUF4097 family beta strand repeat-containing protein [Vicinamibacterales bacterium]
MNPLRTRLPALALVLPAILLLAPGCDIARADHREQARDEWRKTYGLEPGGRVEIGNVNGRISVLPSAGNTVEIVATKTARGPSAEAAKQNLERVEIRESTSAGTIRVETHLPRTGLFNRGGASVEYAVRVPAFAAVKLSTVNGGVEVTGVEGRVVAETTNGGIRGRDLGGAVEASTTNGGVDVEVTRVDDGGITLACTNGGIRLRLPADAKGSISARVTNGGIQTDGLSVALRGEASRRRLDGDLNGGGPRISLEGTNGGIRISAR